VAPLKTSRYCFIAELWEPQTEGGHDHTGLFTQPTNSLVEKIMGEIAVGKEEKSTRKGKQKQLKIKLLTA